MDKVVDCCIVNKWFSPLAVDVNVRRLILPLIELFRPLPKAIFAHLVNSSVALFELDPGKFPRVDVLVTTTGLGFATAVTGTPPLIDLGPAGATGGGFGFPPAPTVVQVPDRVVGGAIFPARSA